MSDEFQDFPVVSEQLIQALEARYPDKMTDSTEIDVICHLQGQVSVVRLLKDVRHAQTDNILSTER
jgi:hypothetical protein